MVELFCGCACLYTRPGLSLHCPYHVWFAAYVFFMYEPIPTVSHLNTYTSSFNRNCWRTVQLSNASVKPGTWCFGVFFCCAYRGALRDWAELATHWSSTHTCSRLAISACRWALFSVLPAAGWFRLTMWYMAPATPISLKSTSVFIELSCKSNVFHVLLCAWTPHIVTYYFPC